MTTTAAYRTALYEAAEKLEWALAAELYQKAYDAYPAFKAGAALYEKDKAGLLKQVERYRGRASQDQPTYKAPHVSEMRKRPTDLLPLDAGERLYTLGLIKDGETLPKLSFFPMTHSEAIFFRSTMMKPNDWILIEVLT